MASFKQLELLRSGIENWNEWRRQNQGKSIDLSKANLANANLQGAAFTNASLQMTDLRGANLENTDLRGANLDKTDLRGANLNGANLHNANLSFANLQGAQINEATKLDDKWRLVWEIVNQGEEKRDLEGTNLTSTNLQGANLNGVSLNNAYFNGSMLQGVNFQGANLSGAFLITANLEGANLKGADLKEANLNKATFKNTLINHKTNLQHILFSPEHEALHDGSDTLILPRRDRWLNWDRLRAIGHFPLFGVSWGALAASLLVINTIGLLNQTQYLSPDLVTYPIPIPHRMTGILISCLLLVLGSTLYRLLCPSRVQEFSETVWVEEHSRPRLQYLAESLRRPFSQWWVLLFTVTGGLLALFLVGERLVLAFRYIMEQLG